MMVQELQCACDGVEKNLEKERRHVAQVSAEAASAQDELQSVLRETQEALENAQGERDSSLMQCETLQTERMEKSMILWRKQVRDQEKVH